MFAIVHNPNDATASLEWREVSDPELKPGEVLVDVKATALNRADISQREGRYPAPPGASEILGLEMAGVVSDPNGSDFKVGDRVMALLSGGGYAEKVAVDARHLIRIPEKFSFEEAAAIPEAFLTAYLNLFFEGELKKDERVLIHGGSSGVGTSAIQLAKVNGNKIATTAGSSKKIEFCKGLGADTTINYKEEDFSEVLKDQKVDLILDLAGGGYLEKNISVLNRYGRLVNIAFMTGKTGTLDMGVLLVKRLKIIGSTLRSRSNDEKAELTKNFCNDHLANFESGKLKPIIETVMPIQKANAAHALMKASTHIGKIVLKTN